MNDYIMNRESLKRHCEVMCNAYKAVPTSGTYSEHRLVLDLLEQTEWIPVSERLPEPNRLVLCHITTGVTLTYFLAFWNDTQNDWEEGIGGYRLLKKDLGYEVIEWMPLPESYNTESEDEDESRRNKRG